MPKASPGDRGFSLLEMVVALAVLVAVVAFLAPTLLSTVESTRSDATLAEMAQIYEAIVGDQRERFGYVGDVGTYPASLADLVISNSATGWRGPYLGNANVVSSLLTDPYGRPYEYYLVSGISGSDQLAIISRGPDGLSTNTAANPNAAANFTGTAPSNAAYVSGANNADNLVYPAASAGNANALNVDVLATLALNIQNFDSNSLVNAFVPACPNLYRVTVTSQTRGTAEVSDLGYAPGFQVDVPQGIYQVLVTAQNMAAAPFNERVTAIPGQTLTRSPNITGLDSSGTDQFVLTVTNKQPSEAIEIYQFASEVNATDGSGSLAANATKTYNLRACAQIFFKKQGATTIRDQMIMPWGNAAKLVGANAATLTVTNNYNLPNQSDTIKIYNNDIFIGDVRDGRTRSFTVGLTAGDVIKVLNVNNAQVGPLLTLVSGANALTVN
ncbi:MAG: prepilin-type N-terminal cleavage/methylation domain-containing protein [Acidimicrobiia bacterium]|nr:prepilin-type N-terminal cleavage/methylation domain-containing protein [Acidimicrobiia bacterium]